VLTDNYAPVETLLNPMTGQPLTNDQETPITSQEAFRIILGVIIVSAVFLLLRKRKVL